MSSKLIWNFVFALIVLIAAFGFGFYYLVKGLADILKSIDGDISKALVAGVITIVVSVITLVIGKLYEQRVRIKQEIRDKKVPIYENQVAFFFKLFLGKKVGLGAPSEKESIKAFSDFSEKMVIWGSSNVITAWLNFRKQGMDVDELSDTQKMDILDSLFLAMREDVGNDINSLQKRALLRMFVNDLPDEDN